MTAPVNSIRISDNVKRIRERMAEAADRAGRRPDEVTLVAVTKTQPAKAIQAVLDAGIRDVAENYVPEAEGKFGRVIWPDSTRRHLIGHLQTNKARRAIEIFDCIQSVDSIKIATRLDTLAAERSILLSVLLEVRLSEEPEKTGFRPEEVSHAVESVSALRNLRIRGLMGMAPFTPDARLVRDAFRTLKSHVVTLDNSNQQILSMGMTGDFEIAIEEGSTMVRIGTALFGAREAR